MSAGDIFSGELATLCGEHLRHEEALLVAALPLARAVKGAFGARGLEAFTAALTGHDEFARLIKEIGLKRQRFREAVARYLLVTTEEVSLPRALARLPALVRPTITALATRVRCLADELAATNDWIAVHLRVHLSAYRRILRDLTNTSAGSGRYGPAGNAESLEYRPMIHIEG